MWLLPAGLTSTTAAGTASPCRTPGTPATAWRAATITAAPVLPQVGMLPAGLLTFSAPAPKLWGCSAIHSFGSSPQGPPEAPPGRAMYFMVQPTVGSAIAGLLVLTSAGAASRMRRRPRIISFARSERQALTRRCKVLSCVLLAYRSGTSVASRAINALAETAGSAINHPSTTGHASANGSTRVFHQCFAEGCLRCVGRASPSFHADARLATKSAIAGVPSSTSTPRRGPRCR